MENSYKLVLFGNGIYQEIELSDSTQMKIGTTNNCKFRFDKKAFFEEFEIEVALIDGSWRMMCSDNLYIAMDGIMKQYSVNLSHGDEVMVKYQNGNAELFSVSFLIDFDRNENKYDRQIDITEASQIVIGGNNNCDIFINNEYIGHDYITLTRQNNGYLLEDNNTQYGIYVNGFKIDEKKVLVNDFDFFMVGGCQFYVKFGHLYTDSKTAVAGNRLSSIDLSQQNNQMQYPKFHRNTRVHVVVPDTKIEILQPKEKPQEPEKNILLTILPTIMSTMMMMVMRSMMSSNKIFVIYCGVMMVIGVSTSLITHFSQGRKYRKDMQKREMEYTEYARKQEEKIKDLRKKEKEALDEIYISTKEEVEEAVNFDSRIFEKDKTDEDYMSIYIGRGRKKSRCEVEYKEQEFKDTEDKLQDYPKMLHDEYEYIDDVPITISLNEVNALGIIGDRTSQYNLLKNITMDLCIRHFYDDVKFFYLFEEQDIAKFSWMRWLKNVRNSDNTIRNFMYDEKSRKNLFEYIYADLSMRESLDEGAVKLLPDVVVFVYSMEGIEKHPVSKYIKKCNKYGYTFIFFNEYKELIPQGCDWFIYLSENKSVLLNTKDKDDNAEFSYEVIDDNIAAYISKKLGCAYVDKVNLASALTSNISLFKLLNIMSVDDLDLGQRWANSKVYESMAAPLGVKSGNEIVCLDLNEKHHGPHGLVAGTTGSGKSEILQSYILSIATLFHPYEIGFVIIDFKGGGMVNQFKNLPHLIGSITNIDGMEIDRSLMSIKAELKKRQEVFAKYNVNHIDAYIKLFKQGKADMPLPHLILIVDEFAELKMDQPEFMKELISAARIGRSLGVHLILATQKPSGVVDDQIWSNSKFKLCLKVQNKQDSNEVLKSPLAAEIKEPGRAYLQVGNNEIFELFQSAYSGADVNADKMGNKKSFKLFGLNLLGQKQLLYEQKANKSGQTQTQLDAIVDYVADYCAKKHIDRLPGICLPSLESVINYEFMARKAQVETDINVCLGIYDDPSNQLQDTLFNNITQNNTFILGSSQYGKTNLLQDMIKGIAMQYTPDEVNIYILDFASMILKTFESLNHVGGVITASDDEKLKNFFKMMRSEIDKRKAILSEMGLSSFSAYRDCGNRELAQIVIMVDNMTALRELYLVNEDNFLPICREGLSVGISVVVTNQQMVGMGYKYLSNFSNRIAFFCNDSGEYSTLFGHCKMKCRNIPGRGICEIDKTLYEFQSYLAFEGEKEIDRVKAVKEFIADINERYTDQMAKKIPEIPEILTEKLAAQYEYKPGYNIFVGLDYKTIMPLYFKLLQMNMFAIIGMQGMGRKNFIENIVKSLDRHKGVEPAEVYVYDDVMRSLDRLNKYEVVKEYSMDAAQICEKIAEVSGVLEERYNSMRQDPKNFKLNEEKYILFIIHNKDAIDNICADKECLQKYKDILSKYKNMKAGFVFSNVENAQIPFNANDIMKQLKDKKAFVAFNNIQDIKITDIPLATAKENKKPIKPGDCFVIINNGVGKIRTVKMD